MKYLRSLLFSLFLMVSATATLSAQYLNLLDAPWYTPVEGNPNVGLDQNGLFLTGIPAAQTMEAITQFTVDRPSEKTILPLRIRYKAGMTGLRFFVTVSVKLDGELFCRPERYELPMSQQWTDTILQVPIGEARLVECALSLVNPAQYRIGKRPSLLLSIARIDALEFEKVTAETKNAGAIPFESAPAFRSRLLALGNTVPGAVQPWTESFKIAQRRIEKANTRLVLVDLPASVLLMPNLYAQGVEGVSRQDVEKRLKGELGGREVLEFIEWLRTYNLAHRSAPVSIAGVGVEHQAGELDGEWAFAQPLWEKANRHPLQKAWLAMSEPIARYEAAQRHSYSVMTYTEPQMSELFQMMVDGLLSQKQTATFIGSFAHANYIDDVSQFVRLSMGFYLKQRYQQDYQAVGFVVGNGFAVVMPQKKIDTTFAGNAEDAELASIPQSLPLDAAEAGTLEAALAQDFNAKSPYYPAAKLENAPYRFRYLLPRKPASQFGAYLLPAARAEGYFYVPQSAGTAMPPRK